MSTLYERNYRRLEALLGRPVTDLKPDTAYRLRVDGFMDLTVELLPRCRETGGVVISLCHYYELNSDLCQDPEMVVRAFPPKDGRPGRLEALSFLQAIPPVYHAVYPQPGRVNPRLRRELNDFLTTWLKNLKAQGHRLMSEDA